MILILATGFALGVLATVLAGEIERRRKDNRRPFIVVTGSFFDGMDRRSQRARTAALLAQDSTLPGNK